jgi:N-acyl-D-aspartate/D-glutamate deacylase
MRGVRIVLLIGLAACGRPPLPDDHARYSVLIRNATVIDGSGSRPYTGSVLIGADTLAYVGRHPLTGFSADTVIDAGGRVVSPGFIDPHAHGDPFRTPAFDNFRRMGVTTIVLGMDGSSPGAEDPDAYSRRLDSLRTGISVLRMVGHGTIRTLYEADTLRMQEAIRRHIGAGVIGLSTGIEYHPGYLADADELAAIARPVADAGLLVASHVRSEDADRILESVTELIEQGRRSGARVHVSHLKLVFGNDPAQTRPVLDALTSTGATADVYPYIASYTGIGIVFPEWALPPNDYAAVLKSRRGELTAYVRDRVNRRNGPAATLFGTAPYAGRTLAQVADSLGKPFEDVLVDDIGPFGASAAYFVMDQAVMEAILLHPSVVVSSDGSPTMLHPRGYGSFARIIREHVMEKRQLPLEAAVRKMSGQTADILGLSDRGYLRTGMRADVLLFDPAAVRDRATFTAPFQTAEGFDDVWVSGRRSP